MDMRTQAERLTGACGRARWLAASALLLALVALITPAVAQEGANQAGLVIQFSDGSVHTTCVDLGPSGQATGEEVLRSSGFAALIDYSSGFGGGTVCKIGNEGCNFPAEKCFCQCTMKPGDPCTYWSYFHLLDGQWRYSIQGVNSYIVKSGAVEGWVWGLGSAGAGVQPPIFTLDQICGAPAEATPPPTLTEPVLPTVTTPPVPTATSMPLPTNTATALQPTATSLPTKTPLPSATPSPTERTPVTDTPSSETTVSSPKPSPVATITPTPVPTSSATPLPTERLPITSTALPEAPVSSHKPGAVDVNTPTPTPSPSATPTPKPTLLATQALTPRAIASGAESERFTPVDNEAPMAAATNQEDVDTSDTNYISFGVLVVVLVGGLILLRLRQE